MNYSSIIRGTILIIKGIVFKDVLFQMQELTEKQ